MGPLHVSLAFTASADATDDSVPSASTEAQVPQETPSPAELNPSDLLFVEPRGALTAPDAAGQVPPYSLVVNDKVRNFLTLFQSAQRREAIERWLGRSGRYREMIQETFRQKGIPEELAYTAMIESGFNPVAVSRAGAKGLWQFMEGTARRYGLTVDRWVDERLDPEKSTRAAAEYLKDLFNQFGSWFLAQAAYNAGEVRVTKAIQRTGSRDFWRLIQTRHLLEETKQFVPAIVAGTLIAKEPDRYGFRVVYQKPEPVDVVAVPVALALRTIAQWTGVTVEALRNLNPELRRGITPPNGSYAVKLPAGSGERLETRLALFLTGPVGSFTLHKVQSTQNLIQIARLYGTTPQEIQTLNGMKGTMIRAGSELVVPVAAPHRFTQARALSDKTVRPAPAQPKAGVHVVRPGDTLGEIALRYQISLTEIARWNGLREDAIIYPGDSLRLTPRPESGS
ncbi:MAG TPA: transglycosylase SLT domain-containing protein [Methylomirabilota bacterium]|nr:transglycosylase SLT domain-containing protein [Methylomirabilota bacterium]